MDKGVREKKKKKKSPTTHLISSPHSFLYYESDDGKEGEKEGERVHKPIAEQTWRSNQRKIKITSRCPSVK